MSHETVVGVGSSQQAEAATAGRDAARGALKRLHDHPVHLAIVFGSSWFDQERLLRGVRSALGASPVVVGCSSAGEITPEGPRSHSCVVFALSSETIHLSAGVGTGLDGDPRMAGQQAAHQAVKGFGAHARSGFLIFADGLATGGADDVLRGIQEVLGTTFLVTGGMAADDLRFTQTFQYARDRVLTQSIVGLLLGGCAIGVGIEHGFAPISKPRHVTKAKKNLLHELDGKPAASVYEEYFGQSLVTTMRRARLSRMSIAYPLGIQLDSTGYYLLRNVRAFREDGSLICTGEIPEGAWIQLMIGSKELALDAARRAAQLAVRSLTTVYGVLVFDSVARLRLFGQGAGLETDAIREVVGSSVPLAGCYTYGEQAPMGPSKNGTSHTSVQTGAVLVIALGK